MGEVSAVYVPELWAAMGIDVLRRKLVMAGLVRLDFNQTVAQFGDTVNTRLPNKLTVRDWGGQEDTGELADNEITVERPTATNVAVVLNNHRYVSFMEEDKPATLSAVNLREQFVEPAMVPLAQNIDSSIMTELTTGTDVAGNAIAEVQTATATLQFEDIIAAMRELNASEAPEDNRRLVLGNEHHAEVLTDSLFVQVDQSGRDSALRRAEIGNVFGFEVFHSQNVPENTDGPQSIAFHRDVVAYVVRPLRTIPPQLGAQVAVQTHQGYSARVIVSYKHRGLGVDISFDTLWGVQLLHAPLGKRIMG